MTEHLLNSAEVSRSHADRVLSYVNKKFETMTPAVNQLLEARHAIFSPIEQSADTPNGTPFTKGVPLSSQLYEEPSYNTSFIYTDIGLRGQGVTEFHNENEKYDPLPTDSSDLLAKKAAYRQAVLAVGMELGFVANHPDTTRAPIDRQLGIEVSELSPIEQPVDAVVVAAAAGLTNPKRLRDTIHNIESGAIKTDRIIVATCDRPVGDAEKARTKAGGFPAGSTEYESVLVALEALLGTEPGPERTQPVSYGHNLSAKITDTEVVIGETPLKLSVVSAPYNPERCLANGQPATRANTEETFYAVCDLLRPGCGTLVVESHDTWIPYQELIAEKVFGLCLGKDVIGTGPRNDDRVIMIDGHLDLAFAEAVVDEIAKTYALLGDVLVAAENQRK